MRTQLLGLTTAALAVGTLSLGLSSPAHAGGGIDGGNISGSGDVPNSVDVVAYGDGDALAAWARPVPGGTKVYAAVATDGVWDAPKAVTAAAVTNAHDVRAVANDAGDLAVVWNQTTAGEHKVRGARYLGGGDWDGSTLLSPAVDIETVEGIDADMDGAGRVHVAYMSAEGPVKTARVALWAKGAQPQLGDFGAGSRLPSIDVNPKGDVRLSYHVYTNGGTIMVTGRNASVGWLGPQPVPWPGAASEESDITVADDGRAAVLIGGGKDGTIQAVAAKVSAAGAVGPVDQLSATDKFALHRTLAASPNGTFQASWGVLENGSDYVIRQSVAKPGDDFGTASLADPDNELNRPHVGLVSDRRFQAVVHADGGELTVRHRTNPLLPFGEYAAGPTNGAFAADMDRNGDVVVAGVVENGFSSYVQADWYDMSGPVSKVTGPGAQVLAKAFDVKWTAVDALFGTQSTDVIVSSAPWNSSTFSAPKVVGDNLLSGPHPMTGGLGRTYCLEVQSVDKAGNLGQRSPVRCTAIPLDDTALAGGGWTRQARAHQFNNTWTTTTTKGRTLTRTGIKARRLALVVQRVPNGGTVRVTWKGVTIKNLSLKGKAANRVVLPIITWKNVRSGTLQVKVTSANGRPVRIDGLVVAK